MLVGLAVIAPAQSFVGFFDREVVKRIQIAGYRQLSYHNHTVTGDREAYDSVNYGGLGDQQFTDVGQIRLTGRKVLGILDFDAQLQDSRLLDPQEQRFTLRYNRGPVDLSYGDIQGSLLNTNRWASFSRNLRGAQAAVRTGRFAFRAVRSEPKGDPRTITISGNNSAGPYYLQSSQVTRGSERVLVDDVPQRLGQDYSISYEIGSITFDRVIPPTSTIVVSYEAFGFNTDRGLIQGGSVSYDFGSVGRLGVTALEQRRRGGSGLSTRTDRFQGFGDASTPYFLSFEPLRDRPIFVRVDGILQIEGVDYVFDPDNPAVFYFRRFMPRERTIEVTYTPRPTTTVDGDRQVVGLDYRLPLGKRGELIYAQALGRLTNTPTPRSGLARSLEMRYELGKTSFFGSARSIPQGYVSVQSSTFNRNEVAHDWRIEHRPSTNLTYGVTHSNSGIVQQRVDANGLTQFDRRRFTLARAFARFEPDGGVGQWSVEQRRLASESAGNRTTSDISELAFRRPFGSARVGLSYQRHSGRGPITVDGLTENRGFNLDALSLETTLAERGGLQLRGAASLTQLQSGGAVSSGRQITLDAAYAPNDRFSSRARYAVASSGGAGRIGGLQTGFGFGYDGNGFTSGVGQGTDLAAATGTNLSVGATYALTDRLVADAQLTRARNEGPISSNTDSLGYGFGVVWTPKDWTDFRLDLSRTQTRFVSGGQSSNSSALGFSTVLSPPGRVNYRAGLSLLLTGGNSQFAQDSVAFDAAIGYRLAARHNLLLAYVSGSTTGYYPQDDRDLSLTYQYQIWENLALNVRYRIRDVQNRDPDLVGGAYSSRGFDLELSFNFGR